MARFSGFLVAWHRRAYIRPFTFKGFKTGSNAVLRGRHGTSWHSHVSVDLCVCDNTFACFCKVFRRWLACFVAGAALWTCPASFCAASAALYRRVVLRIFGESHCRQGCVKWWQRANCVAGAGHRESVILRARRSIWCRSVVCGMLFCVAGKTLHFLILDTPHSILYTLHFTLCTWHSTLYTLHFTLRTIHCTLHILHSTLCTPHSTLL